MLLLFLAVLMMPRENAMLSASPDTSWMRQYFQNEYTVETERAEVISFNKEYINRMTVHNIKLNRTYRALNANVEIKRDLGTNLEGQIQAYKFQSNEYREFPIAFDGNICEALEGNIFGIQNAFNCGNLHKCPWPKGNYSVCNWGPDYSKFPPHLPTGRYKVDLKVFIGSAVELLQLEGYLIIKSVKWDFG